MKRLELGHQGVASYTAVRALRTNIGLIVWLWEPDRINIYQGRDWKQIAQAFVMDVRLPGRNQGEFHEELIMPLQLNHIVAAASRAGILVEVEGERRPYKIKKSKEFPIDPRTEAAAFKIQRELGTEEEVRNWEWSANKRGDQVLEKLMRLAQNTHVPAQVDAMEALILLADYLLSEPNINGEIIQEPPLDLQGIEEHLVIKDSSAGHDIPGNPGGANKRENTAWAIRNFMVTANGAPRKVPYVYEVQPKGNEILKKTKAQRKIFAQSTSDFVTAQICTHGLVYRPTSLCSKSASSLSMGGNTGYQMLRLLTPELDWAGCSESPHAHENIVGEAWEILNQHESLAEEDKTEWEYNLDIVLKVLFLLATTIQVRWTDKEHYLLPFKDSAASFLCPLVGVTGNLAIAAPHFMPSGHLWTLKGNTGGHKFIVLSYKQLRLRDREQDALEWFFSVILTGDDFLSRNKFGIDYSKFADGKWGCKTKPIFGNVEKVKFIQRFLKMVDKQPRFCYDVERAKVKISMPRKDIYDYAEALKAAALSTGDEDFAEILRKHYVEMKVPRLYVTRDNRCTDASFFDKGVLRSFWSANEQLKRDSGTYYRLGENYSMHPDYFESVISRARKIKL